MRGSRRKRERMRRPHPNLLVREGEFFHVQLLALSIPHFTGCRLATLEIHVPAHALVQAVVHLGQVRRWLAVHKRGQPQPSDVTPTDGEVRNAGKTGDRCQSKSRWRLERISERRVPCTREDRCPPRRGAGSWSRSTTVASTGHTAAGRCWRTTASNKADIYSMSVHPDRDKCGTHFSFLFFFKVPFCKHYRQEASD